MLRPWRQVPDTMREMTPRRLATSMTDTRGALLRLWEAWRPALAPAGWQLRYMPELSPPLWELGHLAWAEEVWLSRNPLRRSAAIEVDGETGPARPSRPPAVVRAASLLPRADALFDPARASHTRRWHLDLPNERRALAYAAAVRERTLTLLRGVGSDAAELSPFEAVWRHEMAHHERWAEMAQTLGLAIGSVLPATQPQPVTVQGQSAVAMTDANAHDDALCEPREAGDAPNTAIDRAPVTWARYLPFIEAGGYDDAQWWSAEGWAWRRTAGLLRPRHLAIDDDTGDWKRAVFGRWEPLDPAQPAVHVSAHEAMAWCRWAGRRLPTTAEWLAWHTREAMGTREAAASAEVAPPADGSRQVREWTVRGTDDPWATVLCGSSFAALPALHDTARWEPEAPERNDRFSGFRSCSLAGAPPVHGEPASA